MKTFTQSIKGGAYGVAALLMAVSVVLPGIFGGNVSAAVVTSRSIQMSSATPNASSLDYEIKFTTATTGTIKGVVVDFCAESPILGSSTCTKPTSMTVGTTLGTITGLSGSWSATTVQTGRTLVITNASGGSVSSSTAVTIPVSGFTNPSTTGSFYARIFTFNDNTNAAAYTSGTPGSYTDGGGVALSTTSAIGVSATVQEQLTFCVSATDPGTGCSSGVTTPDIVIGNGATPSILDFNVRESQVYYQVTTNASGTTAVNMKGASGNLVSGSNTIPALAGANIAAQTMAAGSGGTAAFGARQTLGSITTGTLTRSAPYNDGSGTQYGMDPASVTSTYGDQIASATGALIDAEMNLFFGATAAPSTPAGVYTASYSLIATSSY